MKKLFLGTVLVGLAGLTLTACHQSNFHTSIPVKMASTTSCPTPTQVVNDMKAVNTDTNTGFKGITVSYYWTLPSRSKSKWYAKCVLHF